MTIPSDIDFMDPNGEGRGESLSRSLMALAHISSCSAVVTDSYHAALIAWRLGIPAVTVSGAPVGSQTSVNGGARWSWRDKRELAASQYGALELVVRAEELLDPKLLSLRIEHIMDIVDEGEAMGVIQTLIEEEGRIALATLQRGLP